MIRCNRRNWIQVLHGDAFHAEADWRDSLAEAGLSADQDWPRLKLGEQVAGSRTTTCFHGELATSGQIFFKRYVYRRQLWLEFWMRPSKPAVECWAYSQLRELGIPTLKVLALGERRRLGILLAGCIVTEAVPNTLDLERFVREVWCTWRRAKRVTAAREIASHLLLQARAAHEAHFFHHDLKFRNLLISPDGDPDSLVWIDAPRASRMPLRARRGAFTDLSGLARTAMFLFSRFELMRFLRIYLGPKADRGEAKRLFRDIEAHLGRRTHKPKPLELEYPD